MSPAANVPPLPLPPCADSTPSRRHVCRPRGTKAWTLHARHSIGSRQEAQPQARPQLGPCKQESASGGNFLHRSRSDLQVVYTFLSKSFVPGATTALVNWGTMPVAFGCMAFCFAGHGVFPAIRASMREPQRFPAVRP